MSVKNIDYMGYSAAVCKVFEPQRTNNQGLVRWQLQPFCSLFAILLKFNEVHTAKNYSYNLFQKCHFQKKL